MDFICQKASMSELEVLRNHACHSLLIHGPEGCGKSYLAKQYASMLDVSDFQQVCPKVDDIRLAMDECAQLKSPILVCIENLDLGVAGASYALLKFLEEPDPNVYIVITCRNINKVPDTILSRSAVVTACPPNFLDLSRYAITKNPNSFEYFKDTLLWKCVRTFKDADIVLCLTSGQVDYFKSLSETAKFKDSVYNILWKIQKYPDNNSTPVELVIRYIIELSNSLHIKRCGISCIRDISQSRIASHAAIAKFVFECKYCE